MKVLCMNKHVGELCTGDCPDGSDNDCMMDLDIPIQDLVAELRTKLPCKGCCYLLSFPWNVMCQHCIRFNPLMNTKDNYREAV